MAKAVAQVVQAVAKYAGPAANLAGKPFADVGEQLFGYNIQGNNATVGTIKPTPVPPVDPTVALTKERNRLKEQSTRESLLATGRAARKEQARRSAASRGRRSTIRTGPLGLPGGGSQEAAGRKQLLGS